MNGGIIMLNALLIGVIVMLILAVIHEGSKTK